MAYYTSNMMSLFEGLEIPVRQAKITLEKNDPSVVALAVERTLAWFKRKDDASGLGATLKHKDTWRDRNPQVMKIHAEYRLEKWHESCGRKHIFSPWQYVDDEDLREETKHGKYEAHYA
jgi:hypothetical protein